jgi:hypothetical protein
MPMGHHCIKPMPQLSCLVVSSLQEFCSAAQGINKPETKLQHSLLEAAFHQEGGEWPGCGP